MNDDIQQQQHFLEPNQLKYLFVASYFEFKDFDRLPAETLPFIYGYLRNEFATLKPQTLTRYVDYLSSLRIKNIIVDNNVENFTFIKPQFKYMCSRRNVNIIKHVSKVYLMPDTPIYATNMFVRDPKQYQLLLYKEFSEVFDNRQFVKNNETYCIINGNAGYIFEDAYMDWCGVQVSCSIPKVQSSMYRLYLVGDLMAKHFVEKNIMYKDVTLKNYYKGLVLFRSDYRIINTKKFVTNKVNEVFNEMRIELDTKSSYIKFIQRDYIYDGVFPDDLLEVLNEYMTETAVYKFITRFVEPGEKMGNYYSEIVVDRYAINKYRKMNIKVDPKTRFPSLRYNEPAHLFIRPDIIQIKGTLNAFFVPREKLFGILARNSFFGSTELLHFDKKLIPYRQSSPPLKIQQETFIVNKQQKLFLTKYNFNTVPAYLLIRGDYESSFGFKTLNELNNPWVHNTLLKLFIEPEIINR
jgi:hypothetical protein